MADITLADWASVGFGNYFRVWFIFGGRGSGKSHAVAIMIVCWMRRTKIRVLCLREFQNSIDDSSKQLLEDYIVKLGFVDEFRITKYDITHIPTGSRCTFRGMKSGNSLRSTEGIDLVWGEEAQTFSESSLRSLFPTIRKEGSRLIFTFNPEAPDDPIWTRRNRWENEARIIESLVNWKQNPWFTKELNEERLRDLRTDPDMYQHIWEGQLMRRTNALVFAGKCEFGLEFASPPAWEVSYFYGADFGFAKDPATLVRCFIRDDYLWFDYAEFGHKIELDALSALYDRVPGARDYMIRGDGARPDIISMMQREGFQMTEAKKGPGSIEAGVTLMKSFKGIKVHARCKDLAQEFMNYSYKVDPKTEEVQPVLEDKWNHGIDAARYALEPMLHAEGVTFVDDQEIAEAGWY